MARTVTCQQIADKARVYADMRQTNFINDVEILALINDAYPELYDELIASTENYAVSEATITIGPSTDSYALPADFYKIIGVDFRVNQGAYITLYPYNENDRNMSLSAPNNLPAGSVRLRYAPAPTAFTALTDAFDGIAGWDRLVSMIVAIDMLDAEESDSSALRAKYARTLQRVKDMAAPRDQGSPATIVDVYRPQINWTYGALKYRLNGDEIRFLNTEFIGADMYPFI